MPSGTVAVAVASRRRGRPGAPRERRERKESFQSFSKPKIKATRTSAAGRVYNDGKTLTFNAKKSIEVRTGSSGVTKFALNGTSLGALGRSGTPETWLFEPPAKPELTQRR